MARRNRETLKNLFRRGALPGEENFHDLIDSTLNMNDEGFNKSPEHGLEIVSQARRPGLLSFFRDENPSHPLWRVSLDEVERRRLQFWDRGPLEVPPGEGKGPDSGTGNEQPALTLGPGPRVGVNTASPGRELDVQGYLRTRGREGVVPSPGVPEPGARPAPVLANGEWHTIAGPLDGCHALEVVAGVGLRRTGRYALLHAIAINAFHPRGFLFDLFGRKKPIRITQGYYRSRSDRIALRWAARKEGAVLQVRTRRDYGEGPNRRAVRIRYHVTELWSDHDMSSSWDPPEGDAG